MGCSMDVFVSGSLAYDRIMDFPGKFEDHILPDKIHVLNVCFTVNSLQEKFGGTAGNIAYSLALLGEKPRIIAAAGNDFDRYEAWLNKHGLSLAGIRKVADEFTAGAYITTDQSDNQITGFNAGAMKYQSSFDFARLNPEESIAIIAPGNLDDMKDYSIACKDRGINYIFDPGQSLPMWDCQEILQCIDGSMMLITNDYELELIMKNVGLSKTELLQRTGSIVTTLGENGSCVCTPDGKICIPAVKPKKVLDPTGAGDAYRGGLIKGLG